MSALLEPPAYPVGLQTNSPFAASPFVGFQSPATGGLPSAPAHPSFGELPLRRPTTPMASAVDPAFRNSTPMTVPPMEPVNPPTTSMGGVSASALMNALQHSQPVAEPQASSLETLRAQMFGNYCTEIEGRMTELRSSMNGEMARGRRTLMERMDELGAGLHRDMVAMRQEMQKELEDLKRDVFSAVMSISALNDKLGLTDSRFRETWMAVTKALTDRIDNQAIGLATSMKGLEQRVDQSVEDRIDELVEAAMIRQVAIWRARQEAAPVAA